MTNQSSNRNSDGLFKSLLANVGLKKGIFEYIPDWRVLIILFVKQSGELLKDFLLKTIVGIALFIAGQLVIMTGHPSIVIGQEYWWRYVSISIYLTFMFFFIGFALKDSEYEVVLSNEEKYLIKGNKGVALLVYVCIFFMCTFLILDVPILVSFGGIVVALVFNFITLPENFGPSFFYPMARNFLIIAAFVYTVFK